MAANLAGAKVDHWADLTAALRVVPRADLWAVLSAVSSAVCSAENWAAVKAGLLVVQRAVWRAGW